MPRGQQRKEVIQISEGVTVETPAKESNKRKGKNQVTIKETKKEVKVGQNKRWDRQVRDELGRFGMSELSMEQEKAIRYLIYEPKMKKEDLWKQLGVSKSTFYSGVHSDKFLSALKKERDAFFKQLSVKALARMAELIDSPDSRTALKACEDVLRENQHLMPQLEVEQKTTEITVTLLDECQEDD